MQSLPPNCGLCEWGFVFLLACGGFGFSLGRRKGEDCCFVFYFNIYLRYLGKGNALQESSTFVVNGLGKVMSVMLFSCTRSLQWLSVQTEGQALQFSLCGSLYDNCKNNNSFVVSHMCKEWRARYIIQLIR